MLKHSKKNKEEKLELSAPGSCLRKACNCEMLSPLQVKQMQRNNILESFQRGRIHRLRSKNAPDYTKIDPKDCPAG